ncbi:single-stranded DNA-binding protein [Brachybacterium aquaticum]|uniref:Single-stranded DNA-binding protein n=1 Tax=Brachybacterium aquaticum TaxID=1432564 RepID=A0A841A7B9_9MICO|nr:single-stranded DNA-binding protein [Brachybacterium aquaticum]MBB5831069.1 single-strand DNA-binding protein [Brachybacterium aquaticum]
MKDIHTTIMGNATADPTKRIQSDGSTTAILRVAVNGRYYSAAQGGFADRKTEYITVFVKRQLATNVLNSVKKGQPLVVTGRLSSSEWTGEDDAQRHSLNIHAEAIGHDLTYGTSTFVRPIRATEVPDPDEETIAASPSSADEVDADPVTGVIGGSPKGSYEPAF